MQKFREFIAVGLVLFTIIGTIAAIFLYENHLKNSKNYIDLQARGISTWSKTEIKVKKNKLARIRLDNKDCVTHGFAIPELDIEEVIIRAGDIKFVEFTPQYEGEYIYQCIVQCDREKHEFMTGKLIVTE